MFAFRKLGQRVSGASSHQAISVDILPEGGTDADTDAGTDTGTDAGTDADAGTGADTDAY